MIIYTSNRHTAKTAGNPSSQSQMFRLILTLKECYVRIIYIRDCSVAYLVVNVGIRPLYRFLSHLDTSTPVGECG